jgi:hypothetical protein
MFFLEGNEKRVLSLKNKWIAEFPIGLFMHMWLGQPNRYTSVFSRKSKRVRQKIHIRARMRLTNGGCLWRFAQCLGKNAKEGKCL